MISSPKFLHLEQFAFDHLLREFNQRVEDAEVALLDRDLEGLHVEPVARQHALGIAPLRVRRRSSPPGLGLIDDVVMDERRRMDDLDHGSEPHRALSPVVEQLRRKQQKRRADALATAVAQIFSDLGDRLDA